MKNKCLFAILMLCTAAADAQTEIDLYGGAAPIPDRSVRKEFISDSSSNSWHTKLVYNVSKPTLTLYPADTTVQSTGTAVIVCPGGGFHALSIEKEGSAVAAWLNKKGVAVFVLKYRLEPVFGTDPAREYQEKLATKGFKKEQLPVIPLSIADGRAAIAYVRTHATALHVLPNRIGILGFSAGGTVAVSSAQGYGIADRPDFVGAIYPYLPKSLLKPAQVDAPPLFIAAATDDPLNIALQNTGLYNAWMKLKRPAELHIYASGGHGFGMSRQDKPSDEWINAFTGWLLTEGFLKPLDPAKTWTEQRTEGFANLKKYYDNLTFTDWAWLFKYKDANSKALLAAPADKKVVFMGNSITEFWNDQDPAFFKDNGYLCRGIGGQVSAQMLVRFREDVINLKPLAVVIEAGTNDIAENRGPVSLENIFGNIISMVELAAANGIKPIIGSVLPASEFSWHPGTKPAEKIVQLNAMLKAYAVKNDIAYIDYWSAMVNGAQGMKEELAQDKLVHPNLAGYKVMEPLAQAAIVATIKKK